MTNREQLEFDILRIADSPIAKTDLWRKTSSQKQDVFDAIDNLVSIGALSLTKEGRKHLVCRVDTNSDDITWNGVIEFQKQQLNESVKILQVQKKLFKKTKTKTYYEGRLVYVYKPIDKEIASELMTFSMQIDHLMQHLNKLQYASSYRFMPVRKAKKRMEIINKIISNAISKVIADRPKELEGLIQFTQLQTRTWNVYV